MENSISKIVVKQGFSDIEPLQCGRSECAAGHSYGPAARSHWLLHFVISGHGRFVSPRGEFSVGRGEIFIIRPYEVTYYEADEEDPWCYFWLGFEATVPLPPRLTGADLLYAPELSEYFRTAYESPDLSEGGRGYEPLLCSCIWGILAALSDGDARDDESYARYVRPALSIMENEYANGITVAEIAARLHLNRSYFSVLFRTAMGRAPHAYLTDLRMERAAMLLTKYKYSVTVTASSVGYPDPFCFSRAFKQHYGISPAEYARGVLISPT